MGGLAAQDLCEVSFDEGTLPTMPDGEKLNSKTLAAYAASCPGVADAKAQGKPAFVYFYTRSTRSTRTKEVPTPQATACRNLERCLFEGLDYRIGVAAKFFVCSRVDVTSVTPQENPVFNTLRAPVVLITASDGSIAALLAGRVNGRALLSAMFKALRRSGIDAAKAVARGEQLVRTVKNLEDEKARLESSLRRAAERIKPGKRNAGTLRQRQAKHQAKLQGVAKKLVAAYDALKVLFRGSPRVVADAA